MDWFEYFCCGKTFSRILKGPEVAIVCPHCYQPVKPFVSWRAKGGVLAAVPKES